MTYLSLKKNGGAFFKNVIHLNLNASVLIHPIMYYSQNSLKSIRKDIAFNLELTFGNEELFLDIF